MRQINCLVGNDLYRDISLLCAEQGFSRSEFVSTIITAQSGKLNEWIPVVKQRREESHTTRGQLQQQIDALQQEIEALRATQAEAHESTRFNDYLKKFERGN